MHTGPVIGLLDTWTNLMREMNDKTYTRVLLTPHGGRVGRIGELKRAGLVSSRLGVEGGHKLTMPFDDIPLSCLLSIRALLPCPTTHFLYRYADNTLGEIFSWGETTQTNWSASIGVISGVLSSMSHVIPVRHKDVYCDNISHGYVLQVLYRAYRLGLTTQARTEGGKHGVVLTKPFDKFTIGDITPMLSNRYVIYKSLLKAGKKTPLAKLLG